MKIITTIITLQLTYRTLLFCFLFFSRIRHRKIVTVAIRIVILAIIPRMIQIESDVPTSVSIIIICMHTYGCYIQLSNYK